MIPSELPSPGTELRIWLVGVWGCGLVRGDSCVCPCPSVSTGVKNMDSGPEESRSSRAQDSPNPRMGLRLLEILG